MCYSPPEKHLVDGLEMVVCKIGDVLMKNGHLHTKVLEEPTPELKILEPTVESNARL